MEGAAKAEGELATTQPSPYAPGDWHLKTEQNSVVIDVNFVG